MPRSIPGNTSCMLGSKLLFGALDDDDDILLDTMVKNGMRGVGAAGDI